MGKITFYITGFSYLQKLKINITDRPMDASFVIMVHSLLIWFRGPTNRSLFSHLRSIRPKFKVPEGYLLKMNLSTPRPKGWGFLRFILSRASISTLKGGASRGRTGQKILTHPFRSRCLSVLIFLTPVSNKEPGRAWPCLWILLCILPDKNIRTAGTPHNPADRRCKPFFASL